MPTNERPQFADVPLYCDQCRAELAGQAWMVAVWTPDTLWAGWALCELCCAMVNDAIRLELAGAGPGGHREIVPGPAPGDPPTSTARARLLEEQDPGRTD